MVSNIANRNVCLILAVSFFAGLVCCVYSAVVGEVKWIPLCSIASSDALFIKLYFTYRKKVREECRQA